MGGFVPSRFPDVQGEASDVIANSDGHRTTPVCGNFDIILFWLLFWGTNFQPKPVLAVPAIATLTCQSVLAI